MELQKPKVGRRGKGELSKWLAELERAEQRTEMVEPACRWQNHPLWPGVQIRGKNAAGWYIIQASTPRARKQEKKCQECQNCLLDKSKDCSVWGLRCCLVELTHSCFFKINKKFTCCYTIIFWTKTKLKEFNFQTDLRQENKITTELRRQDISEHFFVHIWIQEIRHKKHSKRN